MHGNGPAGMVDVVIGDGNSQFNRANHYGNGRSPRQAAKLLHDVDIS